jgi:hypothetical protein
MASRVCPECGEPFPVGFRQHRLVFCSTSHKNAFHKRQSNRGKIMLSLAQTWRAGKRKGSDASRFAFSEMCALLDGWNRADKAAGRRPDVMVRNRRAAGWSAADVEPEA